MKTKFNKKFACIDIGSSKICSSIACIKNDEIRILEFHESKCEGINRGVIKNFNEFENSISDSIEKLEKKSGESIRSAFVNISSLDLKYAIKKTDLILPRKPIGQKEISKLISLVDISELKDQSILHLIPLYYSLDDIPNIKNPLGMVGHKLSMTAILIYVPESIYNNYLFAFEKSHIKIDGVVASPLAAGLGALTSYDLKNGAVLIDIGASLTTISVFNEGSLEKFKVFPFGGINITKDISYALNISYADAERIKILYGRAFRSILDEKEFILIPNESDELINLKQIAKSEIIKAIEPRVQEMLEIVYSYIKNMTYNNIILTGSTTLLSGIIDLSKKIFKKPVRKTNLETNKYPSHVAVGIMNCVSNYKSNQSDLTQSKVGHSNDNIFNSFIQWFNENF